MTNTRNYTRLDPVSFGRQLLTTGDLDPVYIALNKCNLSEDQRNRWLCAYIAFYHAGVASWMSEREDKGFWFAMQTAALNVEETPIGGRWPRASERRHFRGEQATKAVADWQARDERPEYMFEYISNFKGFPRFEDVSNRAKSFRSIGGWSSFKCVDLADACCGLRVDQGKVEPFLYETPKAALLTWADTISEIGANSSMGELQKCILAFDWLGEHLQDCVVPHKPEQRIRLLEKETIACKWKSHQQGHYPIGKDTLEISHAAESWSPVSETAAKFLKSLPVLTKC